MQINREVHMIPQSTGGRFYVGESCHLTCLKWTATSIYTSLDMSNNFSLSSNCQAEFKGCLLVHSNSANLEAKVKDRTKAVYYPQTLT